MSERTAVVIPALNTEHTLLPVLQSCLLQLSDVSRVLADKYSRSAICKALRATLRYTRLGSPA